MDGRLMNRIEDIFIFSFLTKNIKKTQLRCAYNYIKEKKNFAKKQFGIIQKTLDFASYNLIVVFFPGS